jgi:tetratricopeptide (TPR) repeat protein
VSAEAVSTYDELASINRNRYLAKLAATLERHSFLLAQTRHQIESVHAAQVALTLRRELLAHDRSTHLPGFAGALGDCAAALAAAGQPAEALPRAREAVAAYEELTALHGGDYRFGLAKNLVILGMVLVDIGRVENAVRTFVKAIRCAQELPGYSGNGILGSVADVLRRAYRIAPERTETAYRAATGAGFPEALQ